jgi:Zn-dependent M28 family amino/carboxypeptidase
VGADAVREVAVENVCGYWPGGDPALAAEVLVASAHYDHVGIQEGQVYCGADDNASGCAALLAVAEALAAFGPLERSVLLLWVSGEEAGLLGAKAWTQDPWLPLGAAAIANVNLDMVGRNPPALLEYTPTAAHPEHNGLSECLVRLAALEGFTELKSADKDYERSDHAAFAEHLGIPVLYVSTGEHEDYHQPSDTADKVDADKVARVARLVFRLLVEVARDGV